MANLSIVGASARAAAASASRAGYSLWCADIFVDADLRAMVPEAIRCPVEEYPKGFLDLLRQSPDGPWMYTGALENHPNLIREMAAIRPLWGNGLEALLACRSPFNLQRILREAGLPALEVRRSDASLKAHFRWLRKPLAGSAGQGIAFAEEACERKSSGYMQEYREGTPMSATFARALGEVKLLGVTEQLIGEAWLNAPAFRYAGNIGPIEIASELRIDLERIGSALGEQCNLLGLFGVDFIMSECSPWVVEVNPRYAASIEVIELATGLSAIAEHTRAFGTSLASRNEPRWGPFVGKAIVYADRPRVFAGLPDTRGSDVRFADVPEVGSEIEDGWPILSILVRASSPETCRDQLRLQAARFHES